MEPDEFLEMAYEDLNGYPDSDFDDGRYDDDPSPYSGTYSEE